MFKIQVKIIEDQVKMSELQIKIPDFQICGKSENFSMFSQIDSTLRVKLAQH